MVPGNPDPERLNSQHGLWEREIKPEQASEESSRVGPMPYPGGLGAVANYG